LEPGDEVTIQGFDHGYYDVERNGNRFKISVTCVVSEDGVDLRGGVKNSDRHAFSYSGWRITKYNLALSGKFANKSVSSEGGS
jgi:hypothetical protein